MRGPTRCLALVGYRGSGKTTVGRLLALKAGVPFVDTDAVIESQQQCTIAEFFSRHGEAAFRDMEAAALASLAAAQAPIVVATGGGVVSRAENRALLRSFGLVVWLSADPATLAARLAADSAGRPALTDLGLLEEIASVVAARAPLYREVSRGVAVSTDGRTCDDVVREVWHLWA